jgi:hypothetical protein
MNMNKLNYGLIGVIVILCIVIVVISTYQYQCPPCEETQDMTESEVIDYLSKLGDSKEALAECGLSVDSLSGENATIEYFPEIDMWRVEVVASVNPPPLSTIATAVVINMDDDSRLTSAKCEAYKA